MTLLVGIRCRDGVVIASDSVATFGDGERYTAGGVEVPKIFRIHEKGVFASTGAVGMAQLISQKMNEVFASAQMHKLSESSVASQISRGVIEATKPYYDNALVYANAGQRKHLSGASCKTLFAVLLADGPRLINFDEIGTPEFSKEIPFIALGSGQGAADPFLCMLNRVLWMGGPPSLVQGKLAAAWTVWHVSKSASGGIGGPLQMAVLTGNASKGGLIEFVDNAGREAHAEMVGNVERAILDAVSAADNPNASVVPAMPAPPEPPQPK